MVLVFDVFLSLCTLVLVSAASAPEVSNSPTGISYHAVFSKAIDGQVTFTANSAGQVVVGVNITGLPSSGGPFVYHIHAHTVPASGDCAGTLGHFNPYNGSETSTTAAGKEVGDLSGRHGAINGTSLSTSYVDNYLSLNTSSQLFFANLSVVVHYHNLSRLACANITVKDTTLTTKSGSGSILASTWLTCLFAGVFALFV